MSSSLLHSPLTRFSLRCLANLQHLDQLSSNISSPFLLLRPHCFSSSSSSRSFSSVVAASSTYAGILENRKASFVKSSSIKPCSYILGPREKEFLIHPFSSSSSVSDLHAQTEKLNLTDNASKEEEVDESEDEIMVELGVTETSCRDVNPNEMQNGPFVFKIIDNPGDMKITLKGQCDLSESIQVVVHMPEDGHADEDRDMLLDVSVVDKADQCRSDYSIRAYSGFNSFECYCNTTPKM